MGQPSFQASNAIIYLTYGAFLYVVLLLVLFHFNVLLLTMMACAAVSLVSILHGVGDISRSPSFLRATGHRRVRQHCAQTNVEGQLDHSYLESSIHERKVLQG